VKTFNLRHQSSILKCWALGQMDTYFLGSSNVLGHKVCGSCAVPCTIKSTYWIAIFSGITSKFHTTVTILVIVYLQPIFYTEFVLHIFQSSISIYHFMTILRDGSATPLPEVHVCHISTDYRKLNVWGYGRLLWYNVHAIFRENRSCFKNWKGHARVRTHTKHCDPIHLIFNGKVGQ